MGISLARTRAKWLHETRGLIFDTFGFQETLDLREKRQLEDSMGFRGQFDEHRRFQFEMLRSQGLLPSHRFLELGCGPLTAGIQVIDYLHSNSYFGVDIRSSVLNLAWREIGKAGLSAKNPRLICSTCFGMDAIDPNEKFDLVYSFSVLYHLSDEILSDYFANVTRRLKPGGFCLANVNTDLPSDRWLEFPFLRRTLSNYCDLAQHHGLATVDLGPIAKLGFRNPTSERQNRLLRFGSRS